MAYINGEQVIFAAVKGDKGDKGDAGGGIYPTVISDNVADKNKYTDGGYYEYSTGKWIDNSSVSSTGFIPCESGQVFYPSANGEMVGGNVTYYDGYYNYIKGANLVAGDPLVIPDGDSIRYFKISFYTMWKSGYKINLNEVKEYDDYRAVYSFDENIDAPNVNIHAAEIAELQEAINPKVLSDNLANPAEFENGGYYAYGTGIWTERSDIFSTGFIACEVGQVFYPSADGKMVGGNATFWNANKEFISGCNVAAGEPLTIPDKEGVRYFKISAYLYNQSVYCLNRDEVKEYDEFKQAVVWEDNVNAPNIEAIEQKLENMPSALYYVNTYNNDVTVLHKRNEQVGTSYKVAIINKEKFDGTQTKVTIAGTSESSELGDDNCKNVLSFAKSNEYMHVINGGVYLVDTMEADGITVIGGRVLKSTGVEQFDAEQYVLGITEDGAFKTYINETAGDILADGSVYAITGFVPLIEGGEVVGKTVLSICPHYNVRHPRQIIGTLKDGNYFTFCCDGRTDGENGMTLQECIDTVRKDLDIAFAFNLDGGGSTQSTVGKKQINRQIDGRKIPNVICFK